MWMAMMHGRRWLCWLADAGALSMSDHGLNGLATTFPTADALRQQWLAWEGTFPEFMADQAYRLGVSIVNCAFNQCMNLHYGD